MNNDLNKKDISIGHENDLYNQPGVVLSGYSGASYTKKRIERIVTAVYLVSGVLSDQDPLRHTIREEALSLLSFIMDTGYGADVRGSGQGLIDRIEHIQTLLHIAFVSGTISQMNFGVLKGELDNIVAYIQEKGQSAFENVSLTEQFFVFERPDHVAVGVKDNASFRNKGQYQPSAKKTLVSASVSKKTGSGSEKRGAVDNSKEASPRKTVRRERVLEIVRKNGPITIKDISQQIKDCSEKTIQRELTDLIKDNLILRTGERRWSMYSIA